MADPPVPSYLTASLSLGGDPPVFGPPYTPAELDDAQAKYGLAFPPDLIDLYLTHRLARGYDWTRNEEDIRRALAWPLQGLHFDVETNGLWRPEWGERPAEEMARLEVLEAVVVHAPRLIPLFGHRYLPQSPAEAGNPVFSVYQSDIVLYGRDLKDWIDREFHNTRRPPDQAEPRWIPFWSDFAFGTRATPGPAR